MKSLITSGQNHLHLFIEKMRNIHIFFIKESSLIYVFIFIFFVSFSAELSAGAARVERKSPDWFWFFYEHTEDLKKSTTVYRPFYMEAYNKENLFQASLMPVLYWRYKSERNEITKAFFGFYESTEYEHPDGSRDYDNGFIPLFLHGNGIDESEKYLFIYPFGGNIKGKFGYDRISPYVFPGVALFFLFPPSGILTWQTIFFTLASLIPVYTEFEYKDYSGTAIFWPFIAWGKGNIRDDSRFLPFYAHNSKTGWYDNYSYLLLINYRELYLKNDEKYTFFFFPFFGKKWSRSGRMKSYTVIWPFFSWGYDLDKNERIYNLPWPFVQVGESEKPLMKKRIFFPFWGEYKTSTYESMFVTPLYFRIKKDSDYFKSEYDITCLIAWYLKRDYSYKHEFYGRSWRYFKLWPLVQVEWNDSGFYGINALSLLPFRDTEGYEKLYQPFWTLFEYRKKPDGERHLGFILRTYYQVWNDDYFKMKIPVIVNYERQGESVKQFTILFSSIGFERDRNGSYLKFLWVPFRIGNGDEALAEVGDDPDQGIGLPDIEDEKRIPGHLRGDTGDIKETGFDNKFYFKNRF